MSIKGIYDIHCHIVPGVDDGATDIGETVKLLRMEYEQGVRTVIATPHFRFRMFETPAEKVREQFRLVEKAASEISPDLHVYLGCEFHANMEMLPMLREQKVMTMAGSRYVLTEFYEFDGSAGFARMQSIMQAFRGGIKEFGGKKVVRLLDYVQGLDGLPKSDVLKFLLEDNCSLVVRPSGTEPKLKIYISVSAENKEMAEKVEDEIAKTAEKWIC